MLRARFEEHRVAVVAAVVGLVALGTVTVLLWPDGAGDGEEEGDVAAPDDEDEDADDEPDEAPDDEPEPATNRWPLTGMPTDGFPERPALIVKVSNSPEARPQTGLDHADVVFEELTEGGITRFIAVFHSDLPEVVGPVRSARPVDTQVIAGFGAPGFAYSGARDEVRAMLTRTSAAAITEGAPGFFRDDGTYASHPYAPHDLFLRTEPASAAVVQAGARPLTDIGWAFADEIPDGLGTGAPGTDVEVVMSTAYRTSWTFDATTGHYRRAQNDQSSEVTGPGRIGAANVVVVRAHHEIGASGYPETDVLGDGEAVVFRDGRRFEARWSKPTATDPMLILTADGAATFPFRPGATWIYLPDRLPD